MIMRGSGQILRSDVISPSRDTEYTAVSDSLIKTPALSSNTCNRRSASQYGSIVRYVFEHSYLSSAATPYTLSLP